MTHNQPQYTLHYKKDNKRKGSSSAKEAACCVCGNGLSEGHSITAKFLTSGNIMLCETHFELYD